MSSFLVSAGVERGLQTHGRMKLIGHISAYVISLVLCLACSEPLRSPRVDSHPLTAQSIHIGEHHLGFLFEPRELIVVDTRTTRYIKRA